MSYKLTFLPLASEDTIIAKKYLSQYYLGTAEKFTAELRRQIKNVKENPYMFVAYERNPKFRKMLIHDYIGFYTVDDSKKLIRLHRILHGKLNLDEIEIE